ncbi:unnamed protein product [Durusdinium trenchii]|uniref:Uncharacterized protein n=2 Tax=Durusdinium trenchii TaxID=1381693 RepID=A0ABP0NZW4_9DINO
MELKTFWKIGSTWNFACLTYDTASPIKNVIGAACDGKSTQLWGIPTAADRLHLIVNGLCLTAVDVPANNLTDVLHKNVVLEDCDSGSMAQQFQWQDNGIVKLGTDDLLCLDWDVAGVHEKGNVQMYTCNGQTNQMWYQILQRGTLLTSLIFKPGRVEDRCLSYYGMNVKGGDCETAPSVFPTKTQRHAQMFVELLGRLFCLTAYPFKNIFSRNATLKLMRKKEVHLNLCDASKSQAFEMTTRAQIKLQNDPGLCLDWNVGGVFHRYDEIYLFGCNSYPNQRWIQYVTPSLGDSQ